MPPSPRYTIRLPAAIAAQVQAHLRASGTPFAVLMRDALTAYLAPPPTDQPTPADSADSLHALGEELARLRTSVASLERVLTGRRQPADSSADRPLAPADSLPPTEGCPPFDPAKNVLGKLCKRGHEWGTTGQSLLRLPNQSCRACENALRRERRATQPHTPRETPSP